MRKRSTLRDENTPAEPNPTASNEGLDLDNGSHEQELDRAEIIISPPTPSSSIFLHSAPPGLSEGRFGNVSTAGKPAARFVKTHSKRHSLTAACPRKSSPVSHPIIVSGNADYASGRQTEVGQTTIKPCYPHFLLTCDSRGRVEMAHCYTCCAAEETKIVTN
jgi:hypothetical protein